MPDMIEVAQGAVTAIRHNLDQNTLGWSNTVALEEIQTEIARIRAVIPQISASEYLVERLAALDSWLDILFSERKHLKHGGADQVKVVVLSELGKIDRFLRRPDSHAAGNH